MSLQATEPAHSGPARIGPEGAPENYLSADYGIKSWLLTTDHKRIALLYLISISLFFFVGGAFAVLIRLELLTPAGDLVEAETYNKLFTMHGLMMVFFFLLPSIPAVMGNFLLPLMIGAKDLAFPKLNLASWYIYMIGGLFTLFAMLAAHTPYEIAAGEGMGDLDYAALAKLWESWCGLDFSKS